MAEYSPLDGVLDRIRESLATWLPPERVAEMNERVTRAVTAGLERFQLVPKDEFDRQLAVLERLATEVERLEMRVRALETEAAQRD
jgi:BMFP domain-containing protein YqiC